MQYDNSNTFHEKKFEGEHDDEPILEAMNVGSMYATLQLKERPKEKKKSTSLNIDFACISNKMFCTKF